MSRYLPGMSGNPAGRPRKPPDNKSAVLRQKIADAVPEVVESLIELAKAGDVQAARLLLDRALPALRPTAAPATVDLGQSLSDAGAAVLRALSAGDIDSGQASDLAGALGSLARIEETVSLAARVAALEGAQR